MRIGIDARAIVNSPKGIGRYTINILKEILAKDTKNNYFLYSHQNIEGFDNYKNLAKREGKTILKKLKGTLWLQTEGLYLIRKDKLDIFWGTIQVLPYFLPKKIKKILTVHDILYKIYPEAMEKTNLWINKLYLKKSIEISDYIFTVSKNTANDIEKYFKIDIKNKLEITYNGVDKEEFLKIEKNEAKKVVKEKYNIRKNYILALSTIEPRKNLIYLLKAFNAVKDKIKDVELLLVGEKGWKNSEVFEYVEKNLENRVFFTGYVENEMLKYLYSGAELFIMPSKYEGFGIPIIEAISCGTKVIASDIEVFREILIKKELLFSLEDMNEFELKIMETLNLDKVDEVKIDKFDWQKSAEKFLEVSKKND